jgi:protein O-GlcNAc transferase
LRRSDVNGIGMDMKERANKEEPRGGTGFPSMDVSILLCEALRELRRNNLVFADAVAQNILSKSPNEATALNLAGVIASRIGRRDKAVEWFGKALAAAPHSRVARVNFEKACALPQTAPHTAERYLLIKAWGAGFWSDVTHVLGCLLLSEITGRVPITHWGSTSRFGDRSGKDAFRLYFQPVSNLRVDSLPPFAASDIFPRKWRAENLVLDDRKKFTIRGAGIGGVHLLNRTERLVVADFYIGVIDLLAWLPDDHPMHGRTVDEVYRYLTTKYLKPAPEILAAVDDFHKRYLAGGPTIAVHVRGSDKRGEYKNLDQLNERYFDYLSREPATEKILLLTEDARLLHRFRQRFGSRIIATACERTTDDLALHRKRQFDGVRLGREVMIDTYLAARCSRFLGNGYSNVSAIIAVLQDWNENECTLLMPSQLARRNVFFFTPAKYRVLRWSAPHAEQWILPTNPRQLPTSDAAP